jgi:hypothetical protein
LTSGRNCTIIGAAYSWEQSSVYYWRPRADNVKKRLDQLPPTWSHVFEVHAKTIVDLLLAPPRQKYHKVKDYFGFFRFFWKNKKSAILLFCGFLVLSVFHVEHWEGF